MVPQPDAVEAGVSILAQGGCAIDAAPAAFMQGVVDPMMCGIGSLGVLHVHDPHTGTSEAIDGLSTVPQAATADMRADLFERECPDGYALRGAVNELGQTQALSPICAVILSSGLVRAAISWATPERMKNSPWLVTEMAQASFSAQVPAPRAGPSPTRPGSSQDTLPGYQGFFQIVQDARRRSRTLLAAGLTGLIA
ncbi:MAG: gamma-glutamyltransferase [Janthinobacterium lividum]